MNGNTLLRPLTLTALLTLVCAACDEAAPPWQPVERADTTFLLPLASPLSATTTGRHGLLVPRAHFDAIIRHEPLTRTDEPDDLYAALKVVAVRLDPCFVEARQTRDCPSQVRLVLQPVFAGGPGSPANANAPLTTRDAALHAFYDVPPDELRSLAQALLELRGDSPGDTISTHVAPEEAAALVLKRIGEDRLTRITHMSVHASNEAWVFAGFDIDPETGRRTDLLVPGGIETPAHDFRFEQHLTNTGTDGELAATLIPEPVIEPDIAGFLDARRRESLSAEAQTKALSAFTRLLDPAQHDPGTVDCASCHIASAASHFASRTAESAPSAYDDTKNQRMLGYYFAEPTVSPRVVAETDLVVETLNSSTTGAP